MLTGEHSNQLLGHPTVVHLNEWALKKFPEYNRKVLARQIPFAELINLINGFLKQIPDIDHLYTIDTKRLLVILGIWGSSVIRHYQEAHPGTVKQFPDAALKCLTIGEKKGDFREYFNQLAHLSETGHPPRDAYASLVRWNTPTSTVYWNNQPISQLEGVFNDNYIRTYTDDIGEQLILELFKRCEALEKAANDALAPLWNGSVGNFSNDEVLYRFTLATHMLAGIQRLMLDFPFGDSRGKLTADYFIDVFRQFAIHWDVDDVPPSGPQDVEFIKRDLLTGMGLPRYIQHVHRIYPGLLEEERNELSKLFHLQALPLQLLERVGLTHPSLDILSKEDLALILKENPVIVYCYVFLCTNARLSAAHLMLAKRYLFKPMRIREKLGVAADDAAVPNENGITGLAEGALERLNQGRKHHLLIRLAQFTSNELFQIAGVGRCPELATDEALGLLGIR